MPGKGCVLRLDHTTPVSGEVNILESKYPPAAPLYIPQLYYWILLLRLQYYTFWSIWWTAALRTLGAAGPSGIDAHGWKRLCSSFRSASDELCSALALLAGCMCTTFVDPAFLSSLIACQLINLYKIQVFGLSVLVRQFIVLLHKLSCA